MGFFFGASFSGLQSALIITQFATLPIFLFSGLIINQDNMPGWLGWLRFLSPFRFALEAGLRNEFENNPKFDYNNTPAAQLSLDISCGIV
jgi:ABC-type multidrug transport system permease subunit